MNRSPLSLLPLAAVLALAFGGAAADAQSLVRHPPSLTQPEAPAAPARGDASITTRSTVSGGITQLTANAPSPAGARQIVGIGNVLDLRDASGTVRANGSLVGSLVQQREGGGEGGEQEISIGRVSGSGRAQTLSANGLVQAAITQTTSGAVDQSGGVVGGGRQRVDVGGVRDALGGGTLEASGVVSGAGVTQTQQAGTTQEVLVGSLDRVDALSASANGDLRGQVTQTSTGFGGPFERSQRVAVGAVRDVTGAGVLTNGTLSGDVTQSLSGGSSQAVDIATVREATIGSSAVAVGAVSGAVVQQASGDARQVFEVASVSGRVDTALAQGTVTGNVSQTASDGGAGDQSAQTISVGSVSGANGRVTTQATVGARLSQSIAGSGVKVQRLRIASVLGSNAASVTTRASVSGSVTQSLNDVNGVGLQRTEIGSVVRPGAGGSISTDVVVDGTIVQAGSAVGGSGGDQQSILLGSVTSTFD